MTDKLNYIVKAHICITNCAISYIYIYIYIIYIYIYIYILLLLLLLLKLVLWVYVCDYNSTKKYKS